MKIFSKFKRFSRDIKLIIITTLIMSCFGVYAAGDCIISATSYNDTKAFRNDTYKSNIKTITLDDHINEPADVIESWDIVVSQNEDVMAYITQNSDDNNLSIANVLIKT